MFGPEDPGRGVEGGDERLEAGEGGLVHEVALVDHDDRGELHLLGHELCHRARVRFVVGPAALDDVVLGAHVLEEARRVDDRDHGVDGHAVGDRRELVELQRQGLGHREGLRDPGRLDAERVVPAVVGDAPDLLEEVLAQGAAAAAVGELDEALVALLDLDPSVAGRQEQLAVEALLAHLVDEDRDAAALAVGEQVGEEGGLAGAEEAGENGDGEAHDPGAMPLERRRFRSSRKNLAGHGPRHGPGAFARRPPALTVRP